MSQQQESYWSLVRFSFLVMGSISGLLAAVFGLVAGLTWLAETYSPWVVVPLFVLVMPFLVPGVVKAFGRKK